MKSLFALALTVPLITACATTQAAASAEGPCSNDALPQFVGQQATADLGARIIRVSGAKTLQWVGAGMMVTMDFRPDRVRVFLDGQNKVERVSCG